MTTANDIVNSAGEEPASTISAALKLLRDRSRELLRQQADRVHELEDRLTKQFTAAVEEWEREPPEIPHEEQQLFDRVASLERDLRHLQQLRRESEQALDEARIMLAEFEEERRILRERLDQAEGRPAGAPVSTTSAEETERLKRRLEMAMQEVRDLNAQNADLVEQAKRPEPGPRVLENTGQQFDWESQKQRLLEQLASSFDASDPAQAKERKRCEDVIRTTDRVIAEKDREIAELRQQLAARSAESLARRLDNTAETLLSGDETIRAERARLAEIQTEWQEKLRQAEVEISIERAKLARERNKMEEKIRLLAAQSPPDPSTAPSEVKTPNRGRWLNRLGLSNDNEKA